MDSMLPQLLHLAAPVAGLALMCMSHALMCRANPQLPLLNGLAAAGMVGLAGVVLTGLAAAWAAGSWLSGGLTSLLVDLPIYGCLAYGYANFVNLGQSSVRVRIYRELLGRPEGIEGRTLRAEYDENAMLQARLERLVAAGDLRSEEGRYTIGRGRLIAIAAVVFGLKRAILGSQTEFTS